MKKILLFFIILVLSFMSTTTEEIFTENNLKKHPEYGFISIPKIGLNKKFIYSGNVDKNIIAINESDYPEKQKSLLILASHSGSGKYTFFNYLYKLKKNDTAIVTYDNKQYMYTLANKYNIKKNGQAKIYKYKNMKSLVLITCTNNVKGMQTVYIFKESL